MKHEYPGSGPTPYKKSHSASPGTFAQHKSTASRGAVGKLGNSDQFKGDAQDVSHPGSHAEFERLGCR